ncbi:menaquinone biosynthesis protein [Paenibacillus sp. JX-17]|uniref:Chorismate dehydratase n=1 Tax=Paenibacillus lacisoli TaxID=3064525 RepID=A0ABT9C747_9BACL|nr:menaquinone biosynthesis protein [Paenibacillus sp. JX-17]MDO7905076.1 menaquinone biosynthesis protein [Paenibacillus sp. JX-17]
MMQPDSITTVGKIQYTNAWPIFHYFDPAGLHNVELVTDIPAGLNRRVHAGLLDISAMSSFAYASVSEKLLLLPDLSVSADGDVKSILLFSRKPIEEVANGRIALTNTSATSVNLLKILLEKAFEGKPAYFDSEPELEKMMENADAALLIGDHAIKASWSDHNYIVTDLGRVWKDWTGHSMTFAVWAVQKSAALHKPEAVAEIAAAFRESKRLSLADLQPVVIAAQESVGGDALYWEQYFTNLCYDFGEKEQKGLALYFRYAHEMGLLDHEVNLDIWSDNTVIWVNE